MKTEQLMRRQFNGGFVEQRTSDGYFNATSLLDMHNSYTGKKSRCQDFKDNENTKAFMIALANNLNDAKKQSIETILPSDLYKTKRGKGGSTFMHPYLFVKFAMWLSPELEVVIIKWVYDNLIEFRNQAGDHYKEMCSAILRRYETYYNEKPNPLVFSNEAKYLNSLVCGKFRAIERNELSEKELDLLNNLQKLNIEMLNRGAGKDSRHRDLRTYSEFYRIANF